MTQPSITLPSHILEAFVPEDWGDILRAARDAVPVLDESHLVVTSGLPSLRRRFVSSLRRHLDLLPHARIVNLASIGDAYSDLSGSDPEPIEVDGDGGHDAGDASAMFIHGLRHPRAEDRHQYFIWHDAEALLAGDTRSFARTVHQALAAAAEHEFVSPEVLVLQRHIFLGGDGLKAFADDPGSPFRVWLEGDDAGVFPNAAALCERPRVHVMELTDEA